MPPAIEPGMPDGKVDEGDERGICNVSAQVGWYAEDVLGKEKRKRGRTPTENRHFYYLSREMEWIADLAHSGGNIIQWACLYFLGEVPSMCFFVFVWRVSVLWRFWTSAVWGGVVCLRASIDMHPPAERKTSRKRGQSIKPSLFVWAERRWVTNILTFKMQFAKQCRCSITNNCSVCQRLCPLREGDTPHLGAGYSSKKWFSQAILVVVWSERSLLQS